MLLRRVLVGAPLAVLVALLAHVFEFGESHAVAGARGPGLIAGTVGALALLCALAPLWIAALDARGSDGRVRLRAWLPGGNVGSTMASLALGGYVVLGLIEASEGHAAFLGSAALVGLLVAALIVTLAARFCCDRLADCGSLIARAMRAFVYCAPRALVIAHPPLVAARVRARGARRGRAPPNFA